LAGEMVSHIDIQSAWIFQHTAQTNSPFFGASKLAFLNVVGAKF